MPLKEGMKVNIYRDPGKDLELEGEAVLVMRANEMAGAVYDKTPMQMWYVKFIGCDLVYQRLVKIPEE